MKSSEIFGEPGPKSRRRFIGDNARELFKIS